MTTVHTDITLNCAKRILTCTVVWENDHRAHFYAVASGEGTL